MKRPSAASASCRVGPVGSTGGGTVVGGTVVSGAGGAVVGGTVSVNITPEDVKTAIFDGFFPLTPFDAEPTRGARSGLQEMGPV